MLRGVKQLAAFASGLIFLLACTTRLLPNEGKPLSSSPNKPVATFPLPDNRKFEIYMEEVKMEYDYDAPRGTTYKAIWVVLRGVVSSELERREVWKVNYIENYRDTQFTKPKYIPRDFRVVARDRDRIGLAFIAGPSEIAFYQLDLSKTLRDPDAPPKLPAKPEERQLESIVHHRYFSSIWQHSLPISVEGSIQITLGEKLSLFVGLADWESQQLLERRGIKLTDLRWDAKSEKWIIQCQIGPCDIEFVSAKEEDPASKDLPWKLSQLKLIGRE
jgi:hypothetical protein